MAALPLFLGLLLAASAVHKAVDRDRMAAAAARLAGTGAGSGPLLLILSGAVEAIAALCIAMPTLRTAGALIAAVLWLAYAAALARRHGQSLDCGCDLVARERPVGLAHILRPAALALLALFVAGWPQPAFTLDAPFAAAGLLALYLAAAELFAIPQPSWRKS